MRIRNAMAALTLAAAPAVGADFETGQAAFDSGRFDEAPAERRAAADEGDGRAMPAPGRVHVRGVGAPRNYIEAHMRFDLAAGRGESAAAQERDAPAAEMTAERVASAHERAARRQPAGAGSVFRDCRHCPEMVVVPPGRFMAGPPTSEEDGHSDEALRHSVTIGSPLAVGVHEVTRGEFGYFASSTNRSMRGSCWVREDGEWKLRSDRGWRSPGFSQTDSHPVVCVNWDDARAYVQWLSHETGESYRLLSGSEWEYAARAGTATRYWWGADIGRNRANCDGCGSRRDGESTAPVGSFAANGFGLRDVHGNVWEWVQDCWNASYAGAPGDGSAWESGDCSERVVRGGSWSSGPRFLRAAYRSGNVAGNRFDNLGFRVARTLAP